MCGRFTLRHEAAAIELFLGQSFEGLKLSTPRYNIAPGQVVAALINSEPFHFEMLKWGLVPFWARDPSIGNRLINARGETVAEKPSFRKAFHSQRCLIFADGFYEWQKTAPKVPSTPYYFQLSDGGLFAFAGLWERWQKDGHAPIHSCTLITTMPNELVALVHDRMPVMLDETMSQVWLGADDPNDLLAMLRPFPADRMKADIVSRMVNSPANDSPDCIVPVNGVES